MLALGVTMLVSVAAAPPPSVRGAEKLASTYDEAFCDPAEGGECADEVLIDLPPLQAILDCASPFIAEMIGSCDLPKQTIPSLHVPTLRTAGSGFSTAPSGTSERLTVVATPTSVDAAMVVHYVSLAPPPLTTLVFAAADTSTQDAPPFRLDRPPRF